MAAGCGAWQKSCSCSNSRKIQRTGSSQDDQRKLILEREFDLYVEVPEATQLFLKILTKYILGKCKRSELTVEGKG